VAKFQVTVHPGRKSEAIEWNWAKAPIFVVKFVGIWEIWPSDEKFLILISILANSDPELVELEVIEKP
jgi:hypothetical protein